MVLYYKNNYTVFPKAKSYDGSVDIIFISNATKFAFVIGDAALVDDNEVYREFDMNFPANAPYGEYTYVIAPHTQFSDKWVLKNEILDSLYEGTVLRDVMLETGLLIFVDEEEKAQPEYRERDKKQNESNFIYRKRKELEEKEPIVPPEPDWYTYYLTYVYPENATVRFYTDATMTVEITDLQKIPYASIYVVGEADGYMTSGKEFNGVPNSFVFVNVILGENPYPPQPEPIYWYNVGVVSEDGSPIESVITYYTDETMTEVIEGADLIYHSSIYVYVEADGYEPQGQLLNGIPDGNVYVEFKLKKVVPPTPELKYSYAVGSAVPETATVKWYKDSSMTVEVTELIEIDDSSLYVYAEAEGYKPQGKTVNGRLDDIMIVDFTLEKIQPEPSEYCIATYKSTDDLIIDFENSTEWDNWGEGVKLISNTYENGIGTLVFDNMPTHFCVVSIPNISDRKRLKMLKPNEGLEVLCNKFVDGASNLTEVIIPDTVKTIEYNAFSGAHSLKSLTIPASVEEIQSYGLATATVSELSAHLTDIKFLGYTPPTVDDDFIGRRKLTDLTVHYPKGADYSKLCSNEPYMFGYLGATCIADL